MANGQKLLFLKRKFTESYYHKSHKTLQKKTLLQKKSIILKVKKLISIVFKQFLILIFTLIFKLQLNSENLCFGL